MAYVGSIKQRLEITATLKNEYNYSKPSYTGFGYDERAIYIFEDADGNVYKCDTASVLGTETKRVYNDEGNFVMDFHPVYKGDVVTLRGTVKAHSEYKGVEQTVLNRVKVLQIVEKAKTKEQIEEDKRREQMDSLQDGDELMQMAYANYKKHYSDCETLAGSFINEGYGAYITVIVRSGRLVNSGTRGRHFDWYEVTGSDGTVEMYKAVSEITAERRFRREHRGIDVKSVEAI